MTFRFSPHRLAAALAVGAASVVLLAGARTRPAWLGTTPTCDAILSENEAVAIGVPAIAREFRGAWMSPVEGGEWPSRPDMSPEDQRAELRAMLDRSVALGLNAVVLHVRTAADAMYPTARAPWSSYLTRARGAPDYDPLAFAVAEAHARGLQLHAWFNPFRAAPPDGGVRPGASFIARAHPRWIVRYGSQTWIDPGIPDARRAVLDALLEVVERYDIDGVHLDDYFYPYQETRTIKRRVGKGKKRHTVVTHRLIEFPDDGSWARYGRGNGWESRADWRRGNINDLVSALYAGVKARKPWVLVGISPFGIWRPGSPSGISGLDAYSEIFADSRKWLREGWVDYLAPQLYWQLDGDEHRFARLDAWWRTENVQRRHVWPGLFTMRVASRGDAWPSREIPAEIDALRRARSGSAESDGHVHFRLASMDPGSPLGTQLASETYAQPALPPASPWLGDAAPARPLLDICRADSTAIDSTPSVPNTPIKVTKDVAAPIATGAMLATPHAPPSPDALHVRTMGGAAPRWWVVQLRDASGTWSQRTLPGDLDAVPAVLPSGEPATLIAITAVSPSGVASPRTVARLR